jgi:hypothetical protein
MDTGSARSRLAFIHNPTSPNSNPGRHMHVSSPFSCLIYKDLLSKATALQLLQVLGPRGDSGPKQHGQTVLNIPSPLNEITGGVALAEIDRNDYRRYVEAGRLVAKTADLVTSRPVHRDCYKRPSRVPSCLSVHFRILTVHVGRQSDRRVPSRGLRDSSGRRAGKACSACGQCSRGYRTRFRGL